MGKGTRNRLNREVNPKPVHKKKTKKTYKPLPKFVKPLVSIVILVAIVFGATFGVLASNGVFKRANVLVKSQTGHYDVNQQMGTYLAWQMAYYQAYYIWQIYSSQLSSSYDSVEEYCLNSAASAIQGQLKSTVSDLATDYMIQYAAVCDAAEKAGYSLTKEEIKEAKEQAVETLMSYDCYSYPTTASFIKAVIGNNVKQKDIEAVGVMEALYSKFLTDKQEGFKGVDLATVIAYRDANPASFYNSDYVSYETEDMALATELKNKTDKNSFVSTVAKSLFDQNYKAEYNKYVGAGVEASALLTTLTGLTAETVSGKLTEAGISAQNVTEASAIDETLRTWIMDSSRKQYDATSIVCGEKYVVAVITKALEGDTVQAAWKEFNFSDGTAFGNSGDADYDASFKDNLYATLLAELKLTETAPAKDYSKSENAKILSLYTVLLETISKGLPESTTVAYTADPGDDVVLSWLYGNMTDLTSSVKAGDTKAVDPEAEAEKKVYTVYLAEKVMYLDETVEEGETAPAWETSARSAYASAEVSKLIEGWVASYSVSEKGMNKLKDKTSVETTEE